MENDSMATKPPPLPSPAELVQVLDQATQMAKQLPAASGNPDHRRLIFSSLHSAQISLSSFISMHNYPPAGVDNCVSSAGADELMVEDGIGGEEQDSKDSTMEGVEEKMRDSLYIQNKRPKRPLSPTAAAIAERWGLEEREDVRVRVPVDFNPRGARLRNLELVYQFHG